MWFVELTNKLVKFTQINWNFSFVDAISSTLVKISKKWFSPEIYAKYSFLRLEMILVKNSLTETIDFFNQNLDKIVLCVWLKRSFHLKSTYEKGVENGLKKFLTKNWKIALYKNGLKGFELVQTSALYRLDHRFWPKWFNLLNFNLKSQTIRVEVSRHQIAHFPLLR